MRTFDSPINSSHLSQAMKLKNHESPITKLTNLADVRGSYQPETRINNVLGDRGNEIFVPKNAAKYI